MKSIPRVMQMEGSDQSMIVKNEGKAKAME